MLWRPKYHRRLAQLADGLSTAASFILAYFIWNSIRINIDLPVGRPMQFDWNDLWKIITLSVVWVIIFNKLRAYSYQRFTSISREFSIVFKTTLIGIFIFFAAIYLFRFQYVSRTYIFIFAYTNFICLAFEKMILFRIVKIIRKKGKNRKKILIVGTGKKAIEFVQKVKKNIEWGLDIIGFLSNKDSEKGKTLFGKKILGRFSDIDEVLHGRIIDEVIISVLDEDFMDAKKVMEACEVEGTQVRINSGYFGNLAKKVTFDYIYNLPIVSICTTSDDEWAIYLKRLMDIFISAYLLILLSPLFILIAVLIKITSKGSIFYKWNVVGLNKKPFKSWKFRTMIQNAEELKELLENKNEMKGPVFKILKDPRITKIGKFLRKFSLDELPQLWSVLKGDMSLVGPRPAGPHELRRYKNWHRRKLCIKPGITCLWQVNGRNKIIDFDEWVKLDLEYIENWSVWFDMKILLKTIPAVLKGSGL